MPSSRRQKAKGKPAARKPLVARKSAAKKSARPSARKAVSKAAGKAGKTTPAAPSTKSKPPPAAPIPVVRRADGRAHVLSLSFVRDGDEFLARMETDAGQITELKNRALDQLLTLVASELEDLLE
jgi:hypothetical protein